jgi:hypothetical protein
MPYLIISCRHAGLIARTNPRNDLMERSSMKGRIKQIARKEISKLQSDGQCPLDVESINQQLQLSVVNQWKQWRETEASVYKNINEAGFRCYSQFEEDGIILYMLTMLGISNGTVVEMCCGGGDECMSTNLILNHGFKGYLFDGSVDNIIRAKNFFAKKKDCLLVRPEIQQAWITADNVNNLLDDIGAPEDVDFLSLDIDGNDYWIWKAIEKIKPKICCFETHDIIPSDKSLTIPYDPDFYCWTSKEPEFRSVSLLAMKKLSEEKGYTLVGSHKHGFNVFFVRNDLVDPVFKEVEIDMIHNNEWTRFGQESRWPAVKDLGWVEV